MAMSETTDSAEESVEDDESDDDSAPDPPNELLKLCERLESNGAIVTPGRGCLVVEKLGGAYRVTPAGKVEGDGPLAERLASVVAEYMEETPPPATGEP